MFIGYNGTFNTTDELYIEDLGHCALEGITNDGLYFYLLIMTVRGVSTIVEFGPILPDLEELPTGYEFKMSTMKYNSKKLFPVIAKWLNGNKLGSKPGHPQKIFEAKLIYPNEAVEQIKDMKEYFYNHADYGYLIKSNSGDSTKNPIENLADEEDFDE